MLSPLRLAFLAGIVLTVSGMAQAAGGRVQPIRFICNDNGRCFEDGALDRPDALERDRPRDGDRTRHDEERRHRHDDDE